MSTATIEPGSVRAWVLATRPRTLWAAVSPVMVGTALAIDDGAWHLDVFVVVLFAALPTATSAYILARQMGGDSTLMAQVVAATTLVSAATIPVILLILG